ncbi:MAG TPA: glycosyltransferase [Ktedonobacteraceae bacterium]|nr:glycosyltransferase [Ktedonobacteraceae bacterium]
MRILFVTPYVPSRIRVRPYYFIKSLSKFHEVSLVSLLCDEYERELTRDISEYCSSIDLVPLSKARAYANCLRALPTLTPLRVAYYRSPAFINTIRHVIHKQQIDVVHGELIKVVPALQSVLAQESIPCLYDSVDCISSYLEQQYSTVRHPLKRVFVFSELQKMRRYEPRALADFHKVTITSAHDRNHLMAQNKDLQHVHVVSNGVDTEYFAPLATSREEDSLVFCAKLDYFPNAQAIQYFCREVLPLIWKQRPQVRLTIVGSNPPQAVRDLGTDERITVTGSVPDVRPYLGKATVALAPLQVAAGMQNKVLEALAMGVPMVATPRACKSLQVKNGTHLLIADEPQAYAEAIKLVLDDPQLAQKLSVAGRAYVEEHHSWIANAHALSELYSSIAVKPEQQELELYPDSSIAGPLG